MSWLNQILTGSNNETLAFARVAGALVMMVFGFAVPLYAIWTIRSDTMEIGEWLQIWSALPIYLSLIIAAVGALIAGTAFTEPKTKDASKHEGGEQ